MSLFTVERGSQSSPVESSSEDGESSDNRSRCSSVDGFWTSKNIAIFLPTQKLWNSVKQSNNGPISEHLQKLISLLRPNDRCSLAVELESASPNMSRYLAIIAFVGVHEQDEYICLGVEYEARVARVALVVPIYRDTKVKLTGDGRFTLTVGQHLYTFKPVSVSCMWATIQKLHEVIQSASANNYYHGGLSHTWTSYYQARLTSERRTLSYWSLSEDSATRSDSPGLTRSSDREDPVKGRLVQSLRLVMQSVDLECATSKGIRVLCEEKLKIDLKDYRGFIDQQMLTIMGQMEQPSEIFDFLYLGSEWNASNFKEMQDKGIGYVLNITCEIDNFFPDLFHYYNVRVWDTSETDLLKHWDDTYQFIKKAMKNNSKVLVHCKMGVSRSASTVIAFAMKEYKWQLKEALDFVRSKRDCVNPNCGFIQQLRQYEGILGARHNPVWGEKAALRKRTTDIAGHVPPMACRIGSADEDLDIDDIMRDDDEVGMATGGCEAGAKPFVRTSSISRLRLGAQRPKSWAGTKREEEMMKEQNISLYFKSLLSEQQQAPDDLGCSIAGANTGIAGDTATTTLASVSVLEPRLVSSPRDFAPGHRKAGAVKSLDSSSMSPPPHYHRHSIGDASYTSSTGSGGTAALHPSSATLALHSSSPEEAAARTPVADRQPTAQQIESVVNRRLEDEMPPERLQLDSLSQRTPSMGAASDCPSTPGDDDVNDDDDNNNNNTGDHRPTVEIEDSGAAATAECRVRQQVASFESRSGSGGSAGSVASSSGFTVLASASSLCSQLSEEVTLRCSLGGGGDTPTGDLVLLGANHSSTSSSSSPFPPLLDEDESAGEGTEEEARSVTVVVAELSDDVGGDAGAGRLGRPRRVEDRPQISSVHHRVQSIERFKVFSPRETMRTESASELTTPIPMATMADEPGMVDAGDLDATAGCGGGEERAEMHTVAMATEHQTTVDPVPNIERAASPVLARYLAEKERVMATPALQPVASAPTAATAAVEAPSQEELEQEQVQLQQSELQEVTTSPTASTPVADVEEATTPDENTPTVPAANDSAALASHHTPAATATSNTNTATGGAPTARSRFSFSGFRSEVLAGSATATGSSSNTPSSGATRHSPRTSMKNTTRSGLRSMSVSSGTAATGRRSRGPYPWSGKKGDGGSGGGSPVGSPPLRRGETRGSPQASRSHHGHHHTHHHRGFSFMSPRSQRRAILGGDDGVGGGGGNFITYIPTATTQRSASDSRQTPQNFQTLLERFRDMSQPITKSVSDGAVPEMAVAAAAAEGTASPQPSASAAATASTIDSGLAMEA